MTENKRYSFNWERGHPNFWDNHCDLVDCYLTCEDVVNRLNELAEEKEIAIDGIKIADELIKKYGSDELKHEWKKEVTVKYR